MFRDFGVQNGTHAGGPMFSDFVPKSKPSQLGGTSLYFYEYPPPLDILEKNFLRTDYLRETVLIMNGNDLIIPKDFDTCEPKFSVQTNKIVSLLDMSTAWKTLGCFFLFLFVFCCCFCFCFFFFRWKVNTWIIVVLLWYRKSTTLGLNYKPRGHSLENGYRYVCVAPKTLFSCPPGSSQDPHFTMF